MQLTPRAMAEQIEAGVGRFRQLDRQELGAAQARFETAIAELKSIFRQSRVAHEQGRRVQLVGGTCFLAGLLFTLLLAQVSSICG